MCGTNRRDCTYFCVGPERGITLNHPCMYFFSASAGDYESDGEEEAEKNMDNEDAESKEEVGI